MPLAVASASPMYMIEDCLAAAGVRDSFDVVFSADGMENGKPAPDVYLRAAELLRVDIRRCAVLEDSWNGLRAGRAAGATTIMVPDLAPYGPQIAPCCDHVARDLREAEAILCR